MIEELRAVAVNKDLFDQYYELLGEDFVADPIFRVEFPECYDYYVSNETRKEEIRENIDKVLSDTDQKNLLREFGMALWDCQPDEVKAKMLSKYPEILDRMAKANAFIEAQIASRTAKQLYRK